ncbi:hypothetical protein [Streptomyces sp. NPDC059957]|uniref:hypothetical protein n=1 Tax=unclassified Streptomyces TaxID=2593676 RepID=UPI003658834C
MGAIVVEMWPLIIITAPSLLLMVSARMVDRGRRAVPVHSQLSTEATQTASA